MIELDTVQAWRLNDSTKSSCAASLFETRLRGSQLFFVILVWADGTQVRVGIGEIRLVYDGIVVEGRYVTHDPARQFASPYTYTNWDPVNQTDPNGACVWDGCFLEIAIGLAVAGATGAAIDAGVKTGDPGKAFEAFGVSLAMSAAGPLGPGLQLAAPKTFGRFDAEDWAISLIPVAGNAYGAYRSFESGNYASGAVGSAATVYEAFAIYESYDADIQTRSTGPPAPGHPLPSASAGDFMRWLARTEWTDWQATVTGALRGNVMGLVGGMTQTVAGLSTGDLNMAEGGLVRFAAALVPDYGNYSGPLFGDPLFQESPYNTPLDWGAKAHDRGYKDNGYLHTPTDIQLIRNVWSQPWVGSFGGPYRSALTAGFGAKVLTVNPLAQRLL